MIAYLLSVLFVLPRAHADGMRLKAYNISPGAITLSGVSSGAFMAIQMDIAYSKTFSGAASIAGGPYWCAQGQTDRALDACMAHPEKIQIQDSLDYARKAASRDEIDNLKLLNHHRFYIYASPQDQTVHPESGRKLNDFLSAFAPPSSIAFEESLPSAHGFPTLSYGNPCSQGGLPYLLNCRFDTAGAILKWLYSETSLHPPVHAVDGHLHRFDQTEFTDDGKVPLYAHGWIYVPSECEAQAPCRLHVALHGCEMTPDFIGDQFARHAGYNAWAESNRIIVLYPQSTQVIGTNPFGCWDWFGFTGADYALQKGAQMNALKQMVDRLKL